MYLLGFDIGSSSVKVSILDAQSGVTVASAFHPKQEMKIIAKQNNWAEQDPEAWWEHLILALKEALGKAKINKKDIKSIGISYQMHGLVAVDKNRNVVRPSIIWCDSRAVEIGNNAFQSIGEEKCLSCLLNSPGNFTASKLRWVKENEPETFNKIDKIMLPGDYIAMKLTGELNTTISGLSEGIFWNYQENDLADFLLKHYEIDRSFVPDIVPTFSVQGKVLPEIAHELGLSAETTVSYRAGDQPNNAFSLNVLNPGEIAATAGTSGVVYGVSNEIKYDPKSRVNTFAHVNHQQKNIRLGVLLCINGTGILNSWLKQQVSGGLDYPEMNDLAASIPVGSENLVILPFGNGAERVLNNQNPGGSIQNLNFNIHTKAHVMRASQEGIVFSFKYGMDVMESIGIDPKIIRAGHANMFLSPVFREALATLSGASIELYNTDGSVGAARGAGLGTDIYKNAEETFSTLKKIKEIEPNPSGKQTYLDAYQNWLMSLKKVIEV